MKNSTYLREVVACVGCSAHTSPAMSMGAGSYPKCTVPLLGMMYVNTRPIGSHGLWSRPEILPEQQTASLCRGSPMEASHLPEPTEDKLPQHPGALDPAGHLSPSRWLCTAGVPCPQALQALPAPHLPGRALGGQRGSFVPCPRVGPC